MSPIFGVIGRNLEVFGVIEIDISAWSPWPGRKGHAWGELRRIGERPEVVRGGERRVSFALRVVRSAPRCRPLAAPSPG